MNKNIVIALLIGIIVGQITQVHADNQVANTASVDSNTDKITKHDLFEAAALIGILGNSNYYPAGLFKFSNIRGPKFFRATAKQYADALQ